VAELVRISRENSDSLVLRDGRKYFVYSEGKVSAFSTLRSATSLGTWRVPSAGEKEGFNLEMANKAINKAAAEKTYRVPAAIQQTLSNSITAGSFIDPHDVAHASALASGKPVTFAAINWLKNYFDTTNREFAIRGGEAAQAWADKFEAPITAAGFVAQDDMEYFGVGPDPQNPSQVERLVATDPDDNVYIWTNGDFAVSPNSIDELDFPSVISISPDDAKALSDWIDDPNHDGDLFELQDTDPEERNLVTLAYSEIDWEEIDRLEMASNAINYTPEERSENAGRQQRSNDGKFGGPQVPKGTSLNSAMKARLAEALDLVENPAERIAQYIASLTEQPPTPEPQDSAAPAPTTAGGFSAEFLAKLDKFAVTDAPTEDAAPAPEETPENTPDAPLYFAKVDPTDHTAVLDVIAIVNDNGVATAWKRSGGTWVAAPDDLADLEGSTPPPVVELSNDDTTKAVLAQVDQFDSSSQSDAENPDNESTITASAAELTDYSKKQREHDSKKGIALPDGSFPIRNVTDLKNAVKAFGRTTDAKKAEVKKHIKKRARALNRNDLIPEDWKTASIFDDSHLSPLYGEYGEVIAMVAAAPGRGNEEALRRYWTVGKGAAKIRWGTKGDLTRCHRHLEKYIPGRSWGFCQNLHERVFGMPNATHDKLTGQDK